MTNLINARDLIKSVIDRNCAISKANRDSDECEHTFLNSDHTKVMDRQRWRCKKNESLAEEIAREL